MSEIGTLHHRLKNLVHGETRARHRERVLVEDGVPDPLDAMRVEVSETQLPRRTTFRNDRNEELSLEIASSRVLRLAQPTSPHLMKDAPGDDALIKALTEDNSEKLSEILRMFADATLSLTVRKQLLENTKGALDVGLTVNSLFPAHLVRTSENAKSTVASPLTSFVEASRHICTSGLLLVGSKTAVEHGAEENLVRLRMLAQAEASRDDDGGYNENGAGQCVIYAGHPDTGNSVMCASQGESLVLLTFENSALIDALALWRSHTA